MIGLRRLVRGWLKTLAQGHHDASDARLRSRSEPRGSERPAISLGENRLLTRLDSGEPIVVDGRSIDSLNYLLGWAIERDVIAVFLRALCSKSVFIDVGANFGLFTIKAANIIGHEGRIFAFEPNPWTYSLLRQTAYANLIHNRPNIVISDSLVTDRDGDETLHFSMAELGGASVHRTFSDRLAGSVSVKAVRLDSTIPPDITVDLVKIDVEGHEPFVLQGMRGLIERSPHIKIIMEFFDHFFHHSFGGPLNVQRLIKELGLKVWIIEAGGALLPFDIETPLTGERYILLARSIDDLPPEMKSVRAGKGPI